MSSKFRLYKFFPHDRPDLARWEIVDISTATANHLGRIVSRHDTFRTTAREFRLRTIKWFN